MGTPTNDEQRRAGLAALGAATLGESGARRLSPRVRAVWPGATVCGPAYPVRCTPGDNLAVHVAVTVAPARSVLCVDVGDVHELGYWGEVLTTAAEARGIVGLVIDGAVRDVDALKAHGFGVFSSGTALPGASKNRPGVIGGPVTVGGVPVERGDWVVGDVDGVVAIPGDAVDAVLGAGRSRARAEAAMFEALRSGSTTIELLGLDPSGIEIVD
jgi:4-hydroxy-4-methyl-2-oxoglutarate aldolase